MAVVGLQGVVVVVHMLHEKVGAIVVDNCGRVGTRERGHWRAASVHGKVHGRGSEVVCGKPPWSLDGGRGRGWSTRSGNFCTVFLFENRIIMFAFCKGIYEAVVVEG